MCDFSSFKYVFKCEQCGDDFGAKTSVKIFCSRRCGHKSWRDKNPDLIRNTLDKYLSSDKVRKSKAAYAKAWREAKHADILEYRRKYREENRERITEKKQNWERSNLELVSEYAVRVKLKKSLAQHINAMQSFKNEVSGND